ncbi:mitochondrial ribosomal protein L55 [Halictus rubicundus]|uniref:mitochondrial ribosomal protein L55 n=1 Tax=Halictus rubicundus TaxID=77578 RepID=UPI0040369B80
MNVSPLFRTTLTALTLRRNLNCWTAAITKKHRKLYTRTYPTHLVHPDGSSIIIDYHVPRQIITLPLDVNILNEKARQERILARRKITKVLIQEEEEIDFDETKYFKMKQA